VDTIGIGWQVGIASGWGTYGLNLALQLARRGISPALFFVAARPTLTEPQAEGLAGALAAHRGWQDRARQGTGFDFPILHALGDKLDFPEMLASLRGRPDVGAVFFESAVIPPANLAAAGRLALIVTGSSWNAEVLRRHGVERVANCPQGVDLNLFRPGAREGRFAGRFAIFSGGKLEYRKGQDLVVAAFKRFHARHPEALLVTAWHSPWPATAAKGLALSPHVVAPPPLIDGRLDVGGWLTASGLPDRAFLDLGPLPNAAMPPVLAEMDLAVFPSRCEGGTNLVAMECMACGVPVVLSRNTGHLDLIAHRDLERNCYPLDLQIPMGEVTGRADLQGWGESSIEELAARMEEAFTDSAARRARGAAGAAFMQAWDWSHQVEGLLAELAKVC
jgi:glycosyltransferase involved in cell wall biosynthesis